jgi:hypothetical protein
MRVIHRYLGFFLAGIMAMYALSGTVLIFRNTDFLKQTKTVEKQLDANLAAEQLGEQLRMRGFSATGEDANIISFREGKYDKNTGFATYTTKSLPFVLDKMTQIHKATTNSPLFFLNIFFGASLLFFVISTFWMFAPKSSTFVKGLYFTAGGVVLTLIMLFV